MFDEVLRTAKRLERGMAISIPLETDERGFFDRQCPAESCRFVFKARYDQWQDQYKDDQVFCPQCRHEAPASEWMTQDQCDHVAEEGRKQLMALLGQAFATDADRFNRRQRPGFINMSMKWEGPRSKPAILAIPAAAAFQLEVTCDQCGAVTAVIGSAFFCACCGHNAVERVFDDALRKILLKAEQMDVVRRALAAALDADKAALACRSMLESCLQEGVSSFQRLADELYNRFPGVPRPSRNAFQRLDDGSRLWQSACGKGYDSWLTPEELRLLKVLFQKRHLLAHAEGMVDEEYIRKSGDSSYTSGQRLVVTENDARTLVSLLEKLAQGLRESAPRAASSSP